jgi:hypothetical protein
LEFTSLGTVPYKVYGPSYLGPQVLTLDGRLTLTGVGINAARFTIQRLLRTFTGQYYLLPSDLEYTNMDLAKEAAVAITEPLPTDLAKFGCEVARLVIKRDQYVGSGTLDLFDAAKFASLPVSAGGSSGSSDSGSRSYITLVAPGTLTLNRSYMLAFTGSNPLPDPLIEGTWLRIKSSFGFVPKLVASGDIIEDSTDGELDDELTLDDPREQILVALDGKWRY